MAALALGITSARADLIDANFYNAGYFNAGIGNAAASGAAVVGSAGDIWNGIDGSSGAGGPISLVDVAGSATPVTLTYNTSGGSAIPAAGLGTQANPSLMNDYLFNNTSGNITLGLQGLAANTAYDLYVYVASDDAVSSDRSLTLTANSASGMATGDPMSSFVSGQNYLLLAATSDALGDINITEADGAANTSGEIDLNGLQIENAAVPDASATWSLFAISGLGLILFARRTLVNKQRALIRI
jgi:hypothetical protein